LQEFVGDRVWQWAGAGDTLAGMGRRKLISDDEVLRVARGVFAAHGHTATTRAVAEAAGISEAVLYQRFGTKDDLFFAAMRPQGPDVERLLGPKEPPDDARAFLRAAVGRMAEYFAEMIPLGLRVMTHPSFDPTAFARAVPEGHAVLRKALAERLAVLARRGQMANRPTAAARLLVSLAHDWALGAALAHDLSARRRRELRDMVDVVWEGLRAQVG
jgi:AcrR family transcriptional regulator